MARSRVRVAAFALLALAPALSGCAWLTPQPGGPGLHHCLVREVWAVPSLSQPIQSGFGEVNLTGRALAVPVRCGAADEGAVYLNVTARYRADEAFQEHASTLHGDEYVLPPAGQFAGVRARQGWVAATDADLAAIGAADLGAALTRAGRAIPASNTPPKADAWTLNGTVVATLNATSASIATEEGPYLFTRNATSLIVSTNHPSGNIIVTYSVANHSLIALKNGTTTANAQVLDPQIADLTASWGEGSVELRILTTTRFREGDLVLTDAGGGVVAVHFPGIALMSMLQNQEHEVRDNFAALRGAEGHVAVLMQPG